MSRESAPVQDVWSISGQFFAEQHAIPGSHPSGARNVRVFGSVARGDDRSDSDIDLLVDVEAGRTLLDVIGLERDLHEILGRRVDVLTEKGLSPYRQQRILAEATSL